MRRQAGVVALFAGALLAVAGSSRSLYEVVRVDSGYRSEYRTSLWGGEYSTSEGTFEPEPTRILFAVPVISAAVVLVVAAILLVAVGRLSARFALATRIGAVVGAALLVGSVWTVGQNVLVMARQNDPVEGSIVTTVGTGMWTLVAAGVVALAGALLVQRYPETAVYQPPYDDDTDTPPMGNPIHPSVSTEESSPG